MAEETKKYIAETYLMLLISGRAIDHKYTFMLTVLLDTPYVLMELTGRLIDS